MFSNQATPEMLADIVDKTLHPSLRGNSELVNDQQVTPCHQPSLKVEVSTGNTTCVPDFSVEERSTDVYQTKKVTSISHFPHVIASKHGSIRFPSKTWTTISCTDQIEEAQYIDVSKILFNFSGQFEYIAECERFMRTIPTPTRFPNWVYHEYSDDETECDEPLMGEEIPLEPQFGGTVLSGLTALSDMHGITLPDDVLSKIEGIVALFFALRECNTKTQFVSTLCLYMKTLTSQSLIETALTCVKEIFPDTMDGQSGELDTDLPNWLKMFKKVHHNWHLVVQNEGWTRISRTLSLCVGLGLCEASNLECSVNGMRLFQFTAVPKQACAFDLCDAVFNTVAFFVEGGYECMRTGSIDPLLYGDTNLQEFERIYALCEKGATLARAGNLDQIKMDNSSLDLTFIQALSLVREMISVCKNTVLKRTLQDRQEKLRRLHTTFQETRVKGGLREAPFAMGFFGGSGVGKSTISSLLMVILLHKNGYDAADDKIITLNEHDKFMSNYRSYINGIFIDDIGNTKAQFVEKAPTAKIIELVNNVRAYANMAEADMKGKVSIEPKVLITTKNVKDACAHTYSNEPASIARREKIVVTVQVKDKFATNNMLDPAKVEMHYQDAYCYDDLIPDLWDLTLERAFPVPNKTKGGTATIGWEVLHHNGKRMENVGIEELVDLASEMSADHFRQQKDFVEKNNNISSKMNFCSDCRSPAVFCKCNQFSDALEQHTGPLISMLTTRYFKYQFGITSFLEKKAKKIEAWSVPEAVKYLNWLEDSPYVKWTNYLPQECMDYPMVRKFIMSENRDTLRRSIFTRYCLLGFLSLVTIGCSWFYHVAFSLIFLYIFVLFARTVSVEKEALYRRIKEENSAMPEAMKKYRDSYTQYITGACSILAGLYVLSKLWESIKIAPAAQGNLAPTSMKEVNARDQEAETQTRVAAEHNWATVELTPMPCSRKSKCITSAQLEQKAFENTAFFSYDYEGQRYGCDAIFMKSNVAILPTHMWKKDELKADFVRHKKGTVGGNFSAYLSKSQSVPIPSTDFSLVWVPNGGSWADLSEYLPLDRFGSVPASFIHKDIDGCKVRDQMRITPGTVNAQIGSYYGWHYNMNIDTKFGFCMSSLVSQTKGPVLAGFHLAGRTGTPVGAGGLLLKKQFEAAFLELGKRPGVLLSHSEGNLDPQMYDINWFEGPTLHEKSPVNRLDDATNLKVFGSAKGRTTYYSDVVDTPISDHVYDVTGVPNKHGKPKFRKGDPFEESLKFSSKPSIGMKPSLVERAVEDYKSDLLDKLDEMPELKDDISPLTDMQTLAGIDGKRFIDKMPGNTSVGYPLGGAKNNHITRLDPALYPDQSCPVELDQIFWDEYEKAKTCYLTGERYYAVFKACLKDEPTPMNKDKVRVFQCAPMVLQMFTRKYFLPVARFLSIFPLISECAVGVNPYGPEWDELARFQKKFGEDRILAGDYSKYDLRMPAQLTLAAFRVLIDIARKCGYSEEDITIMQGVATDICYPMIAFNGDLLQFIGTNPSGQNLTVYINSIVNSLLLRCGYFTIYPKGVNFRQVCAAGTYGDDVKGSVKEGYDDFNHISFAAFLADNDMKFTMPDKESTPTPYMKDSDADFLKRKNILHPDTGFILGALDEASIFKSLHSVLRSKSVSLEEQSMSNIDGALRDWFNYGREVYEERRQQMTEVAARAGISHGCQMLSVSYDEHLDNWRETYLESQMGPVEENRAMQIDAPYPQDYPVQSSDNTPLSFVIGSRRCMRLFWASRKYYAAPQA